MSRIFLYLRVRTATRFTENEVQEVKAAGFAVQATRIIGETISGSTAAKERPGFQKLLERMESEDVLIITSWTDLAAMPWTYFKRSSIWQPVASVSIASPSAVQTLQVQRVR